MTAMNSVERDVAIVACAISAGVHAALTPSHLAESSGAGLGFLVATLALSALALALRSSASLPVSAVAAVTLGGLIASYALAVTSGLPLLHPEPEPVDVLAVATKLVEATGVAACLGLLRHGRTAVALPATTKGRLT